MRKSYRKIIPMRLKFAAAFADQKDERKPIVLVISDQRLTAENGRAKVSSFFLLSSLARRLVTPKFKP
jgi:hypothetical protein